MYIIVPLSLSLSPSLALSRPVSLCFGGRLGPNGSDTYMWMRMYGPVYIQHGVFAFMLIMAVYSIVICFS